MDEVSIPAASTKMNDAQEHSGPRRELITIATGPRVYMEMALCLARSVWHWDPGFRGTFTIITDAAARLPRDLEGRVRMKVVPAPSGDAGYAVKVNLHDYSEGQAVLFVDADSIAIGPVSRIFDALESESFVVFGHTVDSGWWWCDVPQTLERFGLGYLPSFYGELYYFRRGDGARKIFEHARELAARYDALGFQRLRGRVNEEAPMAVALASAGIKPLPLSAHMMVNPDRDGAILYIDSIGGELVLQRPRAQSAPVLVHFFASGHNRSAVYMREILRWKLAARGVPSAAAKPIATAQYFVNRCILSAKLRMGALRERSANLIGIRHV